MKKKLEQEIDLIGNTLTELKNFQLTDKDAKMLASQLLEDLYNYSTGIKENERKKKKVATPKDIVTIICYGDIERKERSEAIKFYKECAYACDGSEKERYSNVLLDLMDGRKLAWDGVEAPKGYYVCKYCNGLVMGINKDELCDECKRLFGHSLFSEL